MRLMIVLSFWLTTCSAFAEDEPAKKLIEAMEQKIRQAKSIKLICTIEGRLFPGAGSQHIEVHQQFTGANKA